MNTLTLSDSQYATVIRALSNYAQMHQQQCMKARDAVNSGYTAGLSAQQCDQLISNSISKAQEALILANQMLQKGDTQYDS